jgi:aspartate kinase
VYFLNWWEAMTTLTIKFGGTSVGSREALNHASAIVLGQARHWDRLAVLVSAMSGVTDALTHGATTAANGKDQIYQTVAADLRKRHQQVVGDLLHPGDEHNALMDIIDRRLDEFAAFCRSVHVLGEVTPRVMDAITSLGERINAHVLAALLRQQGGHAEAIEATELIVTDDTFQNAMPLMDATQAKVISRLSPLMEEGTIPVITGFIGATEDGTTTTLGRGGSDFSAAIIGNCLDADEVWTCTDVDGVMTADPRMVPEARVIPALSYNEVSELAYFGAKVLHPRTIWPVIEKDIPLWVKNTFNPACPGTCIVRNPETTPGAVKAVTTITDLSMVTVEGRGMMGVPGIAARTFAAVASQGASVLMISQASSEQSICFVIPTDTVRPVVRAVEEEMALELARHDIDRIRSLDDIVIVTAVGAGMRGTPGIAARIFGALAAGSINVIAIAQGSSECSISLVVTAEDGVDAVQQIHREVVING